MKKIGQGWQYSVYDMGNGRVLKKFHSFLRSYWVIVKTIFPFKDDSLMVIPDFSRQMKRKALVSFEILKKRNIPGEFIGNPRFLNTLDFEQDKATPLHDVFDKSKSSEIISIIDRFVIFNKRLLDMGVIDKSFNITKNFGINQKGEIVLIDIGELLDNPEKIRQHCADRVWAKHYVAGCIQDEGARKYFVDEMDKNFGIMS